MSQLLSTIFIIVCVAKFSFAAEINNPQCGENEVLSTCINRECGYRKCSEIGGPIECNIQDLKYCKKACKCIDTYLKAENGTCIPESQCPNVFKCPKVNEYYDLCPSECLSNTCGLKDTKCTKILQIGDPKCPPPACRCKLGYLRNKKGVCVSSYLCPKPIVCGENEIYSECVNGGCGRWNCSQPIEICNKIKESDCIEGCHCKEGFLRADNSTCIAADRCPQKSPDIVCGLEEEYDRCINNVCDRRHCSQPDGLLCSKPLPIDCEEGCRCKKGLLKTDVGICIPADMCPSLGGVDGLKKFQNGTAAFTVKFLYEFANANPGVSVAFSPISVLFLLAQLALYASGKSSQQLLHVLNVKNKHKLWSIIPHYMNTLSSQQDVICDRAEKLFGNNQYKFSQSFGTVTKNIFKSEASHLDLSNTNGAANDINVWAAANTHNMIQNLVSNPFDPKTTLVMANAVYFTGVWKHRFDPKYTEQEFYVNKDKKVTVNMMTQTGNFKYAEIKYLDAQVIEIPYVSEKYSLMICLPNNKDGLNYMIDKFRDFTSPSLFTHVFSSFSSKFLDLEIPAFSITSNTDFKSILRKANVTEIFNATGSGLSGIFQDPVESYVSLATQKTTIVVNEPRSSTGLVKAILSPVLGILKLTKNTQFKADHPFAYFVLNERTPILCGLFAG